MIFAAFAIWLVIHKLYAWKDYAGEVQRLISLVGVPPGSNEGTLLDVACGTGLHFEHMVRYFRCDGLGISEDEMDSPTHQTIGGLSIT